MLIPVEACVPEAWSLAVRERLLGADHPDTMTVRKNLALAEREASRAGSGLSPPGAGLWWNRHACHTRLHVSADRAARRLDGAAVPGGRPGPLLLLALAFVVSGIASFVVLSRQRDVMSGALLGRLKNGRNRAASFRARLEEGARAEDED